MLKRSSANYSLWPEQARPRRGLSLTLAAGGFAIGIVCAIAANNVLSDFMRPAAAVSEPAAKNAPVQKSASVGNIPVYTAAPASAVSKGALAAGDPAARSQGRQTASKVTLPVIGTQAAAPASETDGRSVDTGTSVKILAEKSVPQPNLIREAAKPASDPPGPLASLPEETKPAVGPEQVAKPAAEAAKPRKKVVVHKKRERSYDYRPSYAGGYRDSPAYGAWGQSNFGRIQY